MVLSLHDFVADCGVPVSVSQVVMTLLCLVSSRQIPAREFNAVLDIGQSVLSFLAFPPHRLLHRGVRGLLGISRGLEFPAEIKRGGRTSRNPVSRRIVRECYFGEPMIPRGVISLSKLGDHGLDYTIRSFHGVALRRIRRRLTVVYAVLFQEGGEDLATAGAVACLKGCSSIHFENLSCSTTTTVWPFFDRGNGPTRSAETTSHG